MSGWIKFEKDLQTDPRVLRMARALATRFRLTELADDSEFFETRNACALPGVTLVCGALSRMWSYADSHARDDDTLDMGAVELDDWLGIPGFCSLMPADWLQVVDEFTVKLPNFQAHNGVEAKKRALTQKRVAEHRGREKRESVTGSNASALPDQDQTKTRPDQEKTNTAAAPRAAAASDVHDLELAELKRIYPKRSGDQRWYDARKAINARLAEGHTWAEILAGAAHYAEWCRATGKIGTETVKQAATFVGPGKAFLERYTTPPTKADIRLVGNLDAAAQAKRELFGGSQ